MIINNHQFVYFFLCIVATVCIYFRINPQNLLVYNNQKLKKLNNYYYYLVMIYEEELGSVK